MMIETYQTGKAAASNAEHVASFDVPPLNATPTVQPQDLPTEEEIYAHAGIGSFLKGEMLDTLAAEITDNHHPANEATLRAQLEIVFTATRPGELRSASIAPYAIERNRAFNPDLDALDMVINSLRQTKIEGFRECGDRKVFSETQDWQDTKTIAGVRGPMIAIPITTKP